MGSMLAVMLLLACLWIIIFYLLPYVRVLWGKKFFVRSVVTGTPSRFGQIQLQQDRLLLKKLSLKVVALTDLELIEGYLETTLGLEEICCVDLTFHNGTKVCLDGSKADHQQLLSQVLIILHADPVDWDAPSMFFSFHRSVLYKSPDHP